MVKVRLGKTGLNITRVGFGGIPIQRVSEKYSHALVRRAVDLGINWIDTANNYGTSEERIGRAIKKYNRESLHLFTKSSVQDPKSIREHIELSLQRLGTTYIDLYQFHFVPSPEKWKEMNDNGTVGEVLKLKEKGIIRHIGASTHTINTALAVMDHPEIEVIQWPFNFIVKEEGLKVLEKCSANDIGFIAMKPFGGGELVNARLCIRFLLQYSDVVTDPGFEKIEEVEEVAALADEQANLTENDLSEIRRLRKEIGARFCRRCGYCMPCPEGVQIVSLMTMESIIKRFPVESILTGWAGGAAASIAHCVECGECEEKCPYELPIMERIKIGAALFEKAKQDN